MYFHILIIILHYFTNYLIILKIPDKSKSKNIDWAQKQEQWYIFKKGMILLIYCVTLLIISSSFVHHLIYLFQLSFPDTKDIPMQKNHLYRYINNAPIPIYPKKILVTLSEKNVFHRNIRLNFWIITRIFNLNIVCYFLNILASQDVLTGFTSGGPITKTIKNLGLTKHSQKTVERMCQMVNRCK